MAICICDDQNPYWAQASEFIIIFIDGGKINQGVEQPMSEHYGIYEWLDKLSFLDARLVAEQSPQSLGE